MINLTTSQQSAFDDLINFAMPHGKEAMACLQGFAGTGKTTLVAKLVAEASPWCKIAVMAPTNKAVGVLLEKIGETPGVEFGSLHSFVGLRMKETDDGKHECLPEGRPSLHEYDLAIIDECSMVAVNLFKTILLTKHQCKILFVGDPAQLPPVGDNNDSPVFRFVGNTLRLKEVVRQALDNPIIAASIVVRQAIEAGGRVDIAALSKSFPPAPAAAGVMCGGINTIVQSVVSEQRNGRDCRAIAWRNNAVESINRQVHQALFPDSSAPFAVGESVIAQNEFKSIAESGSRSLRIFTSEELTVVSIEQKANPDFPDIPAWKLTLERDTGATVVCYVPVDTKTLRAKENALWSDYRALKGIYERREEAKDISARAWTIKKAFAPLVHAYAMTAHKSQGSTFDTVMVDWNDMASQKNDYEFNRMLYVAMTRASKYLGIVT